MNLLELTPDGVTLTTVTVTKELIDDFARITGDNNRIHTDTGYALKTIFGNVVSHGLLTLSLILGMMYKCGLFDENIVIFAGISKLKFIAPVREGDLISANLRLINKYVSKSGNGQYIEIAIEGFLKENNKNFLTSEAKFKVLFDSLVS